MAGTLFVIATPIGNLEDLTFRALRILREVQLVAAEDTRRTSKLLAHYAIQKPLVSLREHNETRETPRLVERMLAGENIGLVSDAGTPGISDPGQHLVAAARAADVTVMPIPGASAITAALSASGLPGTGFTFMGFPPSSGSLRDQWLDAVKDEPRRIVFFESPHRITRTLDEVANIAGVRPIIVGHELSKIHESLVIWDKNSHHDMNRDPKGEFVVMIGASHEQSDATVDGLEASRLFGLIAKYVTPNTDSATSAVAAILDRPVNRVRTAIKKARILAKRAQDNEDL